MRLIADGLLIGASVS